MKATMRVPIGQYAYLELEGTTKDLSEMENMYDTYADRPLAKNNGSYVKVKTFTGENILYNDLAHRYTDEDHNPLVGGSTYAKDFVAPFNKDFVLSAFAKKNDVSEEVVSKMWETSGDVSKDFGTAMHLALERHFTYRDVSGYKMPNHPIVKNMLETLSIKDIKGKCIAEAVVSQVRRLMVGTVDLIVVTNAKKKECEIYDYKFSYNIKKDLKKYQIQINYYARILEFAGWTVNKRVLLGYTDKWQEIECEKIDLTKLEKPTPKQR